MPKARYLIARGRGWICALALLLTPLVAWGQGDLPLERVEVGLLAFGLTAGPGNLIERFEIEVLGVQYDAGLGFPLVLVRASGPVIETSGGVAAGMSGSPVYLEEEVGDLLLGAISYVFPESDSTLALVTPIAYMRSTLAGVGAAPQAFAEHGRAAPVATPLLISGLAARAGALLEPLFAGGSTRLLPLQLVGVPEADEEAYRLEPGAAISVQLVRGDVTIAAVGTVTTIERDGRLLAFGHPLLGSGEVSFPLATAFVSHIVPSRVVPFKLANSGRRQLGVITRDRPAAISGRIDEDARMLPVILTVNHGGGSVVKRFEVIDDDRYHPVLLAVATLQAVDEILERTGRGTADLAWEIGFADGTAINVLEQVASERDVAEAAARLAAGPLALLAGNAFEQADVERVALSVTIEDGLRVAEVVEVAPERDRVAPGEVLEVFVRLQPYRREAVVRTLNVAIPDDAEGEIRLLFRGADVPREGLGELDDDDDGLPPVLSFAELLARLESNLQGSELVVETVLDGRVRRLTRLAFPYVVSGSRLATITVESDEDAATDEDAAADEDGPDAPFDVPGGTP